MPLVVTETKLGLGDVYAVPRISKLYQPLRTNRATVLMYHFGCISLASPHVGLYAVFRQDEMGLAIHCANTRRSILANGAPFCLTNPDVLRKQLDFLASNSTRPLELEANIIRPSQSSWEQSSDFIKTHVVAGTGEQIGFGEDVQLDAMVGVILSRDNFSVEVLQPSTPYSLLMEPHPISFGPPNSLLADQKTLIYAMSNAENLLADVAYDQCFLGYDGKRQVCCLGFSTKLRRCVAAKRRGKTVAELRNLIKKLMTPQGKEFMQLENVHMSSILEAVEVCAKSATCEVCGVAAAEMCAGCLGATYCSEAHQKEDWKKHKTW